ncbi:hypothetical protein [Marinomonas sp. THO17]|uniref:bacteriophage T4 gp5 trimerisation domain-containing protein n=1 Tax=Marinomonas sp. THO17 TaxID=3149048 RepID=UPI00336BDE0A
MGGYPFSFAFQNQKRVARFSLKHTHQGAGFNELSFEDQAGQEQVYLHAQKDLKQQVLNDVQTNIGNDHHLTVANDSFMEVKNNQHIQVTGERRVHIEKDQAQTIHASLQQQISGIAATEVAQVIQLQSGDLTVIEADAELTIKVGESFVSINSEGVFLVAPEVNIGAESYETEALADMITTSDFSFSG